MTATMLLEALDLTEATLLPDTRVIENVILIKAGMSANRRFYSESVLQSSAPVFEGAKAYANHPAKSEHKERPERSIRDITGWYQNVRFESGALRADRFFTRNQAGNDAWAIAEDVITKRAPASLAGLSINAVGTGVKESFEDGEGLRVESITQALSVDDVTTPAAGGGYVLTASAGDDMATALIASMSFEEWQASKPEFITRLKNEWKTVRLEEATKTALADADQKVKAAEADAARMQAELNEAREQVQALSQERDAALAEAQGKERELMIERALWKSRLPQVFVDDLRPRLLQADPSEWGGLIEAESRKMTVAGKARIPVNGAPTQTAPDRVLSAEETFNPLPQPGEDYDAWLRRTSKRIA